MKSSDELAKMLIYGFVKNWSMKTFAQAVGVEINTAEKCKAAHEIAAFLPVDMWPYSAPCRAFVAANYPSLSAYLIKHETEPAKLLAVSSQLVRLKCLDKHGEKFNDEDKAEQKRERKIYRRAAFGAAAYTASKNSQQRGAWTVCK